MYFVFPFFHKAAIAEKCGTIVLFYWNGKTQKLIEKLIWIHFKMFGQTPKSIICWGYQYTNDVFWLSKP
jgi:hypothetical protein